MNMERSASNVKRIIIEREDGTTETVSRGLIAYYSACTDSESGTVNFDLCGLSGKDLGFIVLSIMQLGTQLGMFADNSEEDEEE